MTSPLVEDLAKWDVDLSPTRKFDLKTELFELEDPAVKTATMSERVREMFGLSPVERKRKAIQDRIVELERKFGKGNVGTYTSGEGGVKELRREAPTEPGGKGSVVFGAPTGDQGEMAGFRVNTQGGAKDLPFADDFVLNARIEQSATERQYVLDDLKESAESLPYLEQALKSGKLTREGIQGYLEADYGQGNVFPVHGERGQIGNYIILEEGKKPKLFNTPGLDVGDAFRIAPDVGEAIASFLIGAGTSAVSARRGRPIPPAVADAVGDAGAGALRQGVSKLMPGEDFPSSTGAEEAKARALALGIDVAGGQVAGKIGRTVQRGTDVASPQKMMGRVLGGERVVGDVGDLGVRGGVGERGVSAAMGTSAVGRPAREVGKAVSELADEMGVNISFAMATRGRLAGLVENTLRQSSGGMDIWRVHDIQRITEVMGIIDTVVKRTAGPDVGKEEASKLLNKTVTEAFEALYKETSDVANVAFSEVRKMYGGRPVASLRNFLGVIADLYKRYGRDHGDAASHIQRKMKQVSNMMRRDLTYVGGEPRVSLTEIQRLLSAYGKRASSSEKLITELDYGLDKKINAELFGALIDDLDVLAKSGRTGAVGAKGLQEARFIYKGMKQAIKDTRTAIFDNLLTKNADGKPSQFVDDFFSKTKFSPEQVRETMKRLHEFDPNATRQLRGTILREGIERSSRETPDSSAIAAVEAVRAGKEIPPAAVLSPQRLSTFHDKHRDMLRELYVGDRDGWIAWNKTVAMAKVIGERVGGGTSQTANIAWAQGILKTMVRGIRNPEELLTLVGSVVNARRLSAVMNDPIARRQWLRLGPGRRKLPVREVMKILGDLTRITERKDITSEGDQ